MAKYNIFTDELLKIVFTKENLEKLVAIIRDKKSVFIDDDDEFIKYVNTIDV